MRTSWLLSAGLVGATLMYMLDPELGSRRRARARSGFGSWTSPRGRRVDERLSRLLESAEPEGIRATPDDRALARRVRSRLKRAVSYPQLVDVDTEDGRVILTGCVPAEEMESVMRVVHSVRGVRDVDNQLVATAGIESMPRYASRSAGRSIGMPALSLLALLGTGAIAYGVIRLARATTETDDGGLEEQAGDEALSGELRPST